MERNRLIYILTIPGIVFAILVFAVSIIFSGPKVKIAGKKAVILVADNANYQMLTDSLNKHLDIKNQRAFHWLAGKKHLPVHIRPGKYVFSKDLSYSDLINILRSGRQTPVKITFSNIRTINDLAGRVGGRIEADSSSIAEFLSDPSNYSADGFTRETIIAAFIPDTYEFFWNTSAKGFYSRMLAEYKKFWNADRLRKASEKNLKPIEVSILASIIDDEVAKSDEKPKIAGVYLNRLRKGIPLQACPTIKFAMNDFTITRILTKYLKVASPYNTYLHSGFPPGPIGCATVEGIDAVLNAEQHDYFFFAAKADFSGYHNFSRTLAEHNRYAAQYQKELDKRKIFR